MGRYRLNKPLCIPQFVFILLLYTMFYVQLCYRDLLYKLKNKHLLTYLLTVARTMFWSGVIKVCWCAPLLIGDNGGARKFMSSEMDDSVCAPTPRAPEVLRDDVRLRVLSERAIVEGARVLTTTEVPRAATGHIGSGSGGAQRFRSSMCTYTMCASVSSWIPPPIPWVRELLCRDLSMASIICSCELVGSTVMSNIQWGMPVQQPCCHNFVSACVSPVVAVRAPHHMIHIEPASPMRRMYRGRLAVGLRAVPYEPNFLVDYTHPQTQACKA